MGPTPRRSKTVWREGRPCSIFISICHSLLSFLFWLVVSTLPIRPHNILIPEYRNQLQYSNHYFQRKFPTMPRSRTRSASRTRSRSAGRFPRSRSRSPSNRRRKDHSRSPMSNRRRHEGSRDQPSANSCLGVFGLSLYTTERELEKEFGKFGPISKITVVLDGKTGRSRGFAFVTFEKIEDATEARNAMTDSGKIMSH